MKKIGFIVDKLSFGGGERMLVMLIKAFAKLGCEVVIYSYNKDWEQYNSSNIKVRKLFQQPIGTNKICAYKELSNAFSKDKPNAIVCFILGIAEVALWAAKSKHIPFIVSERCDPKELPTSKIHRFLRKIVFRNASGVVFQTNEVQSYFSKKIQQHSVVIPNPVIDDLPAKSDCIETKHKIVSSGRLSPEKNFKMLIKAFANINAPNYTLSIFGDGEQRIELELLIKDLKCQDKVFLPGKVQKVIEHILDADIFVMPSNHEGMPNSLIEGMAMGLAPISTDFFSGGARALINNGINGILIPVGDQQALEKSLSNLISDNDLRNTIKENAIKIRESHSQSIIIPKWVQFIESIAK